MEELSPENRSTPMAGNNHSSSSTLRFLRPEYVSFTHTRENDPLELHESDVLWSFAVSSNSTSPSDQYLHRVKSVISHALPDERCNLIRQQSTVNPKPIPPAMRQEDVPVKLRQSAPVNIPLWPKEFRGNYENDCWKRFDEEEDDDEAEDMVPPHVIVARSHVTFSVFEGAGRTLKGRDLRRVRNAVFQKTGFID